MVEIGLMIEGQEGLTWARWFHLAEAAEALGFASLFRSDHLTSLDGFAQRETLALWPSLTALALRTSRLRFGPLVCSMTFRHPAMVAKMAAAVSELSSGRLDLGLGAGWYAGEHHMFGHAFPAYSTRLQMLADGAEVIKALWNGQPVTLEVEHYRLAHAESHPVPDHLPLIMGGKGQKTLEVVARLADEWNCSYVGVEVFRQKSAELDQACQRLGRDPVTLRRSVMLPFVIGLDQRTIQTRLNSHRVTFPNLPASLEEWRQAGFIGGTPEEVIGQLEDFIAAGATRFMLQHNDLDDMDSLALLAKHVVPHFG